MLSCLNMIGAVVPLWLAKTQLLVTEQIIAGLHVRLHFTMEGDSFNTMQSTSGGSLRAHLTAVEKRTSTRSQTWKKPSWQCMDSAHRMEGQLRSRQQPEEASLRVRGRRQGAQPPAPSGWLPPLSQGKRGFQPCVNSPALPPAGTSRHLWLAQFVPWFSVGLFTKDQGDDIFKIVGRRPISQLISPPDHYRNTHPLNCAPVKINQRCCPVGHLTPKF